MMRFEELSNLARSRGYISVFDGEKAWDISQFNPQSDEDRDYKIGPDGTVSYVDNNEFQWFINVRFMHLKVIK